MGTLAAKLSLGFLLGLLLFSGLVLADNGNIHGDILCESLAKNQTLDLYVVGFNGNRLMLITSNKTGHLVYELDISSLNRQTHQWNLNGTKPVSLKEKFPDLVNSEEYKNLGTHLTFTAVDQDPYLVFFGPNSSNPMTFNMKNNKTHVIDGSRFNEATEPPQGLISSQDMITLEIALPLKKNGTTQLKRNNRLLQRKFRDTGNPHSDIFIDDPIRMTICEVDSSKIKMENEVKCATTVDKQVIEEPTVLGIKFRLDIPGNDDGLLNQYYLIGKKEIRIFSITELDKFSPLVTKQWHEFYTCNRPAPLPLQTRPREPPSQKPSSSTTAKSNHIWVYIIPVILLLLIIIIVALYCLFCSATAGEKKDKEMDSHQKKKKEPVLGCSKGKAENLKKSTCLPQKTQSADFLLEALKSKKPGGEVVTIRSTASLANNPAKAKSAVKRGQSSSMDALKRQSLVKGSKLALTVSSSSLLKQGQSTNSLSKFDNASSFVSRTESDLPKVPAAGSRSAIGSKPSKAAKGVSSVSSVTSKSAI